jgi:purine-binding chemotaxis protein CheW
MADDEQGDEELFVVFRLDEEEIIRVPEVLIRVPRSYDFVEGMVNLRGTVLPVVDLRTRLGLARSERDERQRIVQMLEHVTGAVDDVSRQAGDVIAYAEGAVPSEAVLDHLIDLDELRRHHVMGRQRATHAQTTGGAPASDAEPMIELF